MRKRGIESRREIASANAEARAEKSTQQQMAVAKKLRGNSTKELGRLRRELRREEKQRRGK